MVDRIADIWGARTPHARGTSGPRGSTSTSRRGSTRRTSTAGCSRACVLCSNGCGCDIAVKDGRMVGVRGRATDVVNHGRLGPKGLYGSTPWARVAGPADPPAGPRGRPARRDRLGHRDGPGRRGVAAAARREGPAVARLLHQRAALPRGVLHARRDREGRHRHAAHGRQHPAVHRDRGRGDEGVASARTASPASYTDIEHCDAIFLFGHNMPETQTVLWMRILDRTRGDDPPRDRVRRPPPHARSPRRPSGPAACTSRRASARTSR